MKVLKIEDKDLHMGEIANDLKALQEYVGGYIEVVPLTEQLALICNEEGKLLGLPETAWLTKRGGLAPVDKLRGPMLVCRTTEDGEFTDFVFERDLCEALLYVHPSV